jgi:hypothetical protein
VKSKKAAIKFISPPANKILRESALGARPMNSI